MIRKESRKLGNRTEGSDDKMAAREYIRCDYASLQFTGGCIRPIVGPFVGSSVCQSINPMLFSKDEILNFVNGNFSNDMINNATMSMSDDELVVSNGPRDLCFMIITYAKVSINCLLNENRFAKVSFLP